MKELVDMARSRLRRELSLHMRREQLTEWQLAERIHESSRIGPSERWGSPNLVHRTIAGLLSGKKTQANSLRIIADYLINETHLNSIALNVPDDVVPVAKAKLRFSRPGGHAAMGKSELACYVGVYTAGGSGGGPVTLAFIIDHEPMNNVLLVRAVMRISYTFKYLETDYLEGTATPGWDQLVLELRYPSYGTTLTVNVPGSFKDFSTVPKRVMQGHPIWSIPVTISFPALVDGCVQRDPINPSYDYIKQGISIPYRFRRWSKKVEDDLDIFRDNFDVGQGRQLQGTFPSPYTQWEHSLNPIADI